jgi:hypothetical protein
LKRKSSATKLKYIFAVLLIISSAIFYTAQAFALTEAQFRKINSYDGRFYLPDAASGGYTFSRWCDGGNGKYDLPTTASYDEREATIWAYFRSKGMTEAQTAGIMGNWMQESGLSSTSLQPSSNVTPSTHPYMFEPVTSSNWDQIKNLIRNNYKPGETGFGFAQWTYYSIQDDLMDFAQERGAAMTSFAMQLEFAWSTMQKRNGNSAQNAARDNFMGFTNDGASAVIEATQYYYNGFENTGSGTVPSARVTYAEGIYNDQHGSNGSTAEITHCDFMDDSIFIYYTQGCWDPIGSRNSSHKAVEWCNQNIGNDTIQGAGCYIVSIAIAVSNLLGQEVTPLDVRDLMNSVGTGFSAGGAAQSILGKVARFGVPEYYNLSADDISGASAATVEQVLADGKLIIVGGNGPAPFTTNGHFVVIRGIDPDGSWVVSNPGNNADSGFRQTYDPSVILNNMTSMSTVYK